MGLEGKEMERKLNEFRRFLHEHGIARFSSHPERALVGKTLFFQSGEIMLVARIRAAEFNARSGFGTVCRIFLDLPADMAFNFIGGIKFFEALDMKQRGFLHLTGQTVVGDFIIH